MGLNWMDVSEISFNTFLLMERIQLQWLITWLPKRECGIALRAHPAVAWYFKNKCPETASWVDAVIADAPANLSREEIREAEETVLASCNDMVVYAVDPSVYDAQPFLAWDSEELLSIAEFDDKVVLDIGSGTGRLALTVAGAARTVYAVDPVANLRRFVVEKARRSGYGNVYAVDGLLTEIPFPDGFADITMAGHVFGDDPEAEIAEAERVTKPGGMVIACPGNGDVDNPMHAAFLAHGYEWGSFEQPRDGVKRKYWCTLPAATAAGA